MINCPRAAGKPLGGFRLGEPPDGLTPLGADSEYTSSVNVDGLTGETPNPADPQTTVSMRIFVRESGGMALAVTVLHPDNAAQTRDWLLAWASAGAEEVGAFQTAAGPARLFAHDGSEARTFEVIIDGSALILIDGPATPDDQAAFAQSIVPQ